MAIATLEKQTATLRLNNGTDSSGQIKTVGVSLGQLNAAKWDPDKALAVVDKLESCLSKPVASFVGTSTSTYRAD